MKTRAPYGVRLARPRLHLAGALVFKPRALAFRVRGLRDRQPPPDRFTVAARDLLGSGPRLQ